jgi:hypothetical protein
MGASLSFGAGDRAPPRRTVRRSPTAAGLRSDASGANTVRNAYAPWTLHLFCGSLSSCSPDPSTRPPPAGSTHAGWSLHLQHAQRRRIFGGPSGQFVTNTTIEQRLPRYRPRCGLIDSGPVAYGRSVDGARRRAAMARPAHRHRTREGSSTGLAMGSILGASCRARVPRAGRGSHGPGSVGHGRNDRRTPCCTCGGAFRCAGTRIEFGALQPHLPPL